VRAILSAISPSARISRWNLTGRMACKTACSTADADTDGNGLVSVVEGLPNYGPVLIPMTPLSTTPGGLLEYTAAFDDLRIIEPVNTLRNRAMVLHGLAANGDYIASLPVACGQTRPAPNGGKEAKEQSSSPGPSSAEVNRTDFRVRSWNCQPGPAACLCHSRSSQPPCNHTHKT
jgi:hypothetical protein